MQGAIDLHGRNHPKVGDALNRLGLLYDQRGDHATGLEYFKKGLDVKMKTKAAPISVVYSLSNVANSYNAMGKFEEAHNLVDEAFDILNKEKVNMLDGFSLMYNTRGKIYAKQGNLNEAMEAFTKTVEITRQIERKSYIYMKRLVNLAEVLERKKKFKSSLTYAEEALEIRHETTKALPHNFTVIECLQCISNIFENFGLNKEYRDTLYDIERECYRLQQVCTETFNQEKLNAVDAKIKGLEERFSNLEKLKA